MSGIAGVLFRAPNKVSERQIQALSNTILRRGRDAIGYSINGRVGMAHCAFHTTEESRAEKQPAQLNGVTVVFDGRLDNRSALIATLRSEADNSSPDIALVLAAYEHWGSQFISHLVGDFAGALWDSHTDTLLLFRDAFGVRPLYYHLTAERLLWSSCVSSFLVLLDTVPKIDSDYVASYLIYDPDSTLSPFAGVIPIPPGAYVAVTPSRLHTTRYWSPEQFAPATHKPDKYEEEQYLTLFHEAVETRLRASGPVLSFLSGGLDSSSIVATADTFCAPDGNFYPPVHTVSFVFERARDSDERVYIHEIEHRRHRPGTHILEDSAPFFSYWPDPAFVDYPRPLVCAGGRLQEVIKLAESTGARVLLDGVFGDHVLRAGEAGHLCLVPLIRQLRVRELFSGCVEWSVDKGLPLQRVILDVIRTALPKAFRVNSVDAPKWLGPELQESKRNVVRELKQHRLDRGDRYSSFWKAIASASSGLSNFENSYKCIEVRYPYLHRPLVEFLMRLPLGQFHRPGEDRSIQRRAMAGILPEVIRNRRNKRGPDAAIYLAIERQWKVLEELILTSRAADRGYVDGGLLLADFTQARTGGNHLAGQLLRFLSLEMWLRSFETHRPSHVAAFCEE
jgi:asparagine synthase (glutamine-hydrolysing)